MRYFLQSCGGLAAPLIVALALTGCLPDYVARSADGGGLVDAFPDGSVDSSLPDGGATSRGFDGGGGQASPDGGATSATIVAVCTTDGGACKPATDCYAGTIACTDGGEVCAATTALANGTPCGTDSVHFCADGVCSSCNAGGDCSSASTPCIVSTYDCTSGAAECKVSRNAPEGMACGTGMYCSLGVCGACKPGAACAPPNQACHVGTVTQCASGVATCTDTDMAASDGTSCSTGTTTGVCSGGACVACAEGASCNPGNNPCQNGTISCRSGPSCIFTRNVQDQTAPAACGANEICIGGACTGKCDATSCAGCCSGNTCVPVANETIAMCGTGTAGSACGECPIGTCVAGACACGPGTLDCGGVCATCATPPAGAVSACAGTSCTLACTAAGTTMCGNACLTFRNDNNNCGSCGHVCAAGTTCAGTQCVCNASSGCAGCCSSGTTCEPLASETTLSCGAAGASCGSCGPNKACSTEGDCTGATMLASGNTDTCALLADGTVECWGTDTYGELGNGTTIGPDDCGGADCSTTPVAVATLTGVTAIAAGYEHNCALLTGGRVACWGENDGGQLGDSTTTDPNCTGEPCERTPVVVPGLSGVTAIAAGRSHTCAVLAPGTVVCWGANALGQLGNGSTNASPTPVAVSGLTGVTAIAAGLNHTCALQTGGSVSCWGDNTDGQLGNGMTTQASAPVAVTGLHGITAITCGKLHSCAVQSNGTVSCWGDNSFGELGNGSTHLGTSAGNSATPVAVNSVSGVSSISANSYHTCAVSSGAVQCWGFDQSGELGNGMMTNTSTAVAVTGVTGVVAVNSGGDFTCALESAALVQCWGDDVLAELGNGSMTSSLSPVNVVW